MAGAGPSGAVAAHRLARAGRTVLLVEPHALAGGPMKPGEALAGVAVRVLRACGLPTPDANPVHRPIGGNVSLWGSDVPIHRDFMTEPDGPGWRLDRRAFEADLLDAARTAGATVEARQFQGAEREGDAWRVTLDGEDVTARWLIDATGRRAFVARKLGAERRRGQPLVALIGYGAGNDAYRNERNLIEATPYGWWYAALQPDLRPVFMLHTRPNGAGPNGFGRLERWQAALAATTLIASAFPEPVIDGLRGYEACGAWLKPVFGDGWIACGDAALSFDPCSGQGLLSALQDGMAAAAAVDAALAGDRSSLSAYAARIDNSRAVYCTQLRAHYAAETRWPQAAFWSTTGDSAASFG